MDKQEAVEILRRATLENCVAKMIERRDGFKGLLDKYPLAKLRDEIFERYCILNVGIAAGEALLNGTTIYVQDDDIVINLTEEELYQWVGKAYNIVRGGVG